jgi:hypothetical protein
MRTKCAQKRECEFSTPMTPITYNFNALKCTHFLPATPLCSIRNSAFFRISSLVIRHWLPGASLVLGYWNLGFIAALLSPKTLSPVGRLMHPLK